MLPCTVSPSKKNTQNLATKTLKSIGWVSFAQVITQIIQFIVSAILARLLFPKDFGIIAMIVVFSNFLNVFQSLGMGSAIVQKKDLDEDHINSIFWIVIGLALFLTFLMVSASPLIAHFYKEPKLVKLTIALGTTFFITSLGIVPRSLFRREMQFKVLSLVNITVVSLAGFFAICLAFKGFGVWSLVYRQIASVTLGTILLLTIRKWKPKFSFHWQKIKDMFKFGANLTGFTFVNYFNRNLDNLLIGKFLGAQPLGYYNFSYNMMLYPVRQISGVLGRVFFPALSSIQDNLSRIREVYTKANFFISVITFPLMVGLFVLAPEFVKAIFGAKWINAIQIIKILSLVGLVQSLGTTIGWLYLIKGKTDIMFKWGVAKFIIIVVGFIIGLRWGVTGVALAYAIVTYLILLPNYYIPFRFIDMNIWKFFKNFIPTFSASVIMGITIGFAKYYMKLSNLVDWQILVSCIVIGIIIYTLLIKFFKKEIFREVLSYIKIGIAKESI